MSFQDPQLAALLIFIMAGFVILQTLFFVAALSQVRYRLKKLEHLVETYQKKSSEALHSVKSVLESLGEIGEKLPVVERHIGSALDLISENSRLADDALGRRVAVLRTQVREIDRQVQFGLHQFTRQTARIRSAVRSPGIEVSAVVKGGLALLRRLFSDGRRQRPEKLSSDSEIFI